jgi:serine/threonine protein kinase/Flp pilus assembly protein TadD
MLEYANDEKAIFLAALEQASVQEREAYLRGACGGDLELLKRVKLLLSVHEDSQGPLDAPLPGVGIAPTDDEPITERPGTVIGSYKLLEQIGEGGFGAVFMAEQQQPVRRKVALKVLKPGMATKQVVARFEAERQALALMDHPHIAHVLDAGTTDTGRPYFVMELIRGIPITQFCDYNQLTPRERLELFVTVCQAVQHAHQKGIIHRDLKPNNVLVTLLDDKPAVKVIDFGIAKALGQERLTDKTLFTGFAHMIGTPLYMSPEQAEMSGQDVDTRTDIYSLGVLLYELLTSTTPFDKERLKEASYDEIRRIIRDEEPAKPSTRISTLGQAATTVSANRKSEPRRLSQLFRRELDWIVMKALEKDRNRRYDTASSFAADVQRYLDDEPVQACPPSAGYRLRKFARKNRKWVSVAAVGVLAALLGAGNLLWLAQKRAETAGRVEEILRRAGDLQAQGKWAEALQAAEPAEAFIQLGGGSRELKQRVQALLKDLKMIQRMEEIRLEEQAPRDWGLDDLQDISFLYAEAFRNYGVEVDTLETEQAARRIHGSCIYLELAAALDSWAHFRLRTRLQASEDQIWRHLLEVAQVADPDPWRNQLRSVLERSPIDQKVLQHLADSTDLAWQPAATLHLLGSSLATGMLVQAERVLRQAQQWHPQDFWINAELASCLRQLGKPTEEVAVRTALVSLRPQSAQARYDLGQALLAQGDLERAIAAFNEATRFLSEDSLSGIGWGNALNQKGALKKAIAAFKAASRLQPDEAGIYINWGSALKNQGSREDAVAAYDRAIAILKKEHAGQRRPGSFRALLRFAVRGRVEALFGLGRFPDAEQTFQEAIRLDPSDHWNWHYDAPLRLFLGDVEGYRRDCREMVARFQGTDDPKIADRTVKTCLLLPDAVDDLAPVFRLAERAVTGTQQHWGYRFFLLSRAMADYRAGDFAQAIDQLNRMLSRKGERWYSSDPYLDGTARLFLAMAHQRLGHSEQARQALDQARRLGPRLSKTRGANSLGSLWDEALRFHIVRQEAERLVKDKAKAAGEALRPSNGFTGPASSGWLVCTPGPMALYFYRGPAPQNRRPRAMFLYPPIQRAGGPFGLALAALALLALDTPRAQPGFQAPVSFNTGQVPVFVASGDFNDDGIPDLVTANQADDSVSVLLGNGDGTFQPAVPYAAGSDPSCVVVADFNRDGKLDLAVANYSSHNVSVLLGNGDGTFQAAAAYDSQGGPLSIAVSDFNGDGNPDLIVANEVASSVSVFLGKGDGTFQAAVDYQCGGSPYSVAVGDFNGDGHADLAVANCLANGTVSVLLGNGDGTFQAAQTFAAGNGPSCVAVGDFNDDGHLDLVVALNSTSGKGSTVGLLLGKGDGTFQAVTTHPVGIAPWYVAVGDLNGDGILDLAVSGMDVDSGGGSVSVLLGNGDGTFQAAHGYPVAFSGNNLSPAQNPVAIGDFNRDGKPDLAVANNAGNNVSVLLGNGDGTFPAAPNYSAGIYPGFVAVADFNGDGILDLAVANFGGDGGGHPGTLSILLGKGDGTFQAAVNYPTGLTPSGVGVGDFNGDGIPDLAVSNIFSATLSILLGNGNGTFQAAVNYPAGQFPGSVVVADFNGDGVLDLAVTNLVNNSVSVLLGNGNGSFQAPLGFASGGNFPFFMVAGDFNADSVPDLAVANYKSGTVSIFLGNGDGTFQAAGNYATASPGSIVVGDFNGDGKLDVAVANAIQGGTSGSVSVLLGNGDGTFQASVGYPTGPILNFQPPQGMTVGDVNGDGTPDLVVVFGGGVLVLLGNGDGTFQTTPISYLAGVVANAVAVGDFNGDGKPDLAVTNGSPNGGVSILINDGKWAP